MTTAIGSELDGVVAYLHVTQLERRLSEGPAPVGPAHA